MAAVGLLVEAYRVSRTSDNLGSPGFTLMYEGDVPDPDLHRVGTVVYDENIAQLVYWLEGVAPYYATNEGVRGRFWSFRPVAGRDEEDDFGTYVRLASRALNMDRFNFEMFAVGIRLPLLAKRTRLNNAQIAARDTLARNLKASAVEGKCEECPTVVEVAAAEAATRSKKRSPREGVFAAYRLRGLEDADLEEILAGFDMDALTPPDLAAASGSTAQERPPESHAQDAGAEYKTYWVNYSAYVTPQGKNDQNCLLNELIERYSKKPPKQKAIAEKSIKKFFAGTDGALDTSIQAFINFATKYSIPSRIYNGMSKTAFAETHGANTTKRPGIAILCWNEHAYVFTGDNIRSSEPKLIGDLPGIIDKSHSVRETLDDEAKAIYDRILSAVRPNFFFGAERDITVKSLFGSVEDPTEGAAYVTIDMCKCFYNSLFSAPATDRIGVFTACDGYEEAGERPIEDYCYYFVGKEEMNRWRTEDVGLLRFRCNNLLTGIELQWLLKRGIIKRETVKWIKRPQYLIDVEDFRGLLRKCSEGATEALRTNYGRCLNGLLGVKESTPRRLVMEASEMDAELLGATHPGVTIEKKEGAFFVKAEVGYRRYLHLSNRHLYNYVVARANIAAMECAEALRPMMGAPLRCRTDGFTYHRPESPEEYAEFEKAVKGLPHEFRIEKTPKPPDGLLPHRGFLNVDEIKAEIEGEIKAWFDRHKGYVGPPGTGKTTLVKTKHAGEYEFALSLTNMCARQLTDNGVEGKTLHSGLRLFAPSLLHEVCDELKGRPVWIDEISMVNAWIWSVIFVVGLRTPIIFSGDPRQCAPIGTSGGKIGADELNWKGPLLSYVVANSTALLRDYRNDEDLIRFREAICSDERPDLYMYRLLKANPSMDGADHPGRVLSAPFHIVWGHEYRCNLNAAVVSHLGLEWEKKEVKRPGEEDEKNGRGKSYTFKASRGLRLLARTSKRGVFSKGSFYELAGDVGHESSRAAIIEMKAGSWEPVEGAGSGKVIHPSLLMHFALGYAVTAPSSQGMTVEGGCAIHQLGAMLHKGGEHRELAYTAVTRMRTLSNLIIVVGRLKIDPMPESQTEVWHLKDDEDMGTGLSVAPRPSRPAGL